MGGNVAGMLKKIDAAAPGDAKGGKMVEKMFAKVDKDKSGFIDGQEYMTFLNEVGKYVHGQMEKVQPGDQYDEETCRDWARQWMDPNNDGKISLQELKNSIHTILNADE